MRQRILRDFRQMLRSPAKFLSFNRKVKHALTNNPNCPESAASLLKEYFEKVESLETTYHLALDGGHTAIRQRERLSEETAVLLDQIASALESAHILNPDALLTTGFSVTQERRSANRVKLSLEAPPDFKVDNVGERGRAIASSSTSPAAYNHEIHINQKGPGAEEDWIHKGIFPDSRSMEMEHLSPGDTFFRMRHHGPDGPGPWSTVVSTTIT
jgi:hypothetical protein